jgi:uncharacterized membrane protein (DUF485 family)
MQPEKDVPAGQPSAGDWDRVANMPRFKELIAAKRRFIVPATIFFVVYYFALPVLVGYAPEFMDQRVLGPVNIAYLFALSQFFMAWIVAFLYVRAANKFDAMSKRVLEDLDTQNRKAGRNA